MTINIRLVNDGLLSQSDMDTLTKAVQYFVPKVTSAWNIPDVVIKTDGTPEQGDWLIFLTEKKRKIGAAGYHAVLNGSPVAYCSLKASGRLFGTYIKPLVIKGKTIHGAIYTSGLVTTVCHELAEMLCDPYIQTISAEDAKGRKWLIEVCDHVFGSYENYPVGKTNCVLPDVTTPAFYNLNAFGPYSIFNAPVAPFIMTAKGYGYYLDTNGALKKI